MKLITQTIIFILFGVLSTASLAEEKVDKWNLADFLASSAKFKTSFGLTNNIGNKLDHSLDIPLKLDQDEETYELSIGYKEKPIFRDIWFLFYPGAMDRYRNMKNDKGKFIIRKFFLDAVTLDAKIGYGKKLEDTTDIFNVNPSEFEDTEGTNYSITITYEIALDDFSMFKKFTE